ncbi:MAG: hypothetical protein H6659_19045 [Ardenticatenaceae bacterium]|nr:hypothetical protein [Ardenticatenaceae bacterium]
MTKLNLVRRERTWGDTAVDGLLAGLVGGLVMGLFLAVASWLNGGLPLAVLGYFDPAQAGGWLTGLLAHLAVSAIYGAGLALLLRGVRWIRPSLTKLAWLWGAAYGLLLWGLAAGVVLTAVDSSLLKIPTWEFGLAHLLYGLVVGYRLQIVK